MTDDTTGETAVVKPNYATEEAYRMGHAEFEDADIDKSENLMFGHYTESARWANVIAPKLRAMAGASDHSGKGTYTRHREVAAILPGCEEDTPAEADLIRSQDLFESLVDAFRGGAHDAVAGVGDPDEYTHF